MLSFQQVPSVSPIQLLPEELLRSIVSYLLAYSTITPTMAFHHGSLALTCKRFYAAVKHALNTYIHIVTEGNWSEPPRNWMNAVCTDALRLNIHGVSRRMSLLLGVPAIVLDEVEYDEQQLTRWICAHVFSWNDIAYILSDVYPFYETSLNARSRAVRKRRGWYMEKQARKRQLTELSQRRQEKLESRRIKLESHEKWPLVQRVYTQTKCHDIFGDFFDWKLSCTTKVADIVHRAETTARLLEVLHPDDLPSDLNKNHDSMTIVRGHVGSAFQNAINTVIRRNKQCRAHLCINPATLACINHMCGLHCIS